MIRRLNNWFAIQRDIRALDAKSDRLLADIGIPRDEIPTIVRNARALQSRTKDGMVEVWVYAIRAWLETRRTLRAEQKRYERELNAYSNGDLADLGISRLDIHAMARQLAFNTKAAA